MLIWFVVSPWKKLEKKVFTYSFKILDLKQNQQNDRDFMPIEELLPSCATQTAITHCQSLRQQYDSLKQWCDLAILAHAGELNNSVMLCGDLVFLIDDGG